MRIPCASVTAFEVTPMSALNWGITGLLRQMLIKIAAGGTFSNGVLTLTKDDGQGIDIPFDYTAPLSDFTIELDEPITTSQWSPITIYSNMIMNTRRPFARNYDENRYVSCTSNVATWGFQPWVPSQASDKYVCTIPQDVLYTALLQFLENVGFDNHRYAYFTAILKDGNSYSYITEGTVNSVGTGKFQAMSDSNKMYSEIVFITVNN